MKNRLSIILVITVILVPQVVSAAWWNPLSWKIFNLNKTPVQQVQIATSTIAMTTAPPVTATNKSVVKTYTTDTPKVASPKYPLFSAATEAFFTTPNLITLKEVCEQAKGVPTGDTKNVLSADKLTMQKVPYTLYDQFKEMCDLIGRDDIQFVNATPNAFFLTLANDDSDSVRLAKLKSNDFMKIPNSYAVFYFYSADSQEKKYISNDLSVSCPPKSEERLLATNKATHKIYAPMIYLLSELSPSGMADILGIGLSEKGKSHLSKVGVGWELNIPFYGVCLES